jgi:hypothetical protein
MSLSNRNIIDAPWRYFQREKVGGRTILTGGATGSSIMVIVWIVDQSGVEDVDTRRKLELKRFGSGENYQSVGASRLKLVHSLPGSHLLGVDGGGKTGTTTAEV